MSTSPALRLLRTPEVEELAPSVRFCGQCAHRPEGPESESRICPECGMGVVLDAAGDLAPSMGEPFMVVDRSLTICALSDVAAERLGLDELDALHRPVNELLEPADVAVRGAASMSAALMHAGSGVSRMVVRPAGTYGVRFRMRMGPCGSPAATLLVLEPLGRSPRRR
jgi:hypothetical protein